ncbi:hypothetical protein [Lignipirellula cremea]|uniref:Uncharacterized protein n=1 Tax=Lignipirellula cremea TaxID=2528010 RepID=A0A518DLE7_9BACT|nr:hypothetical protein [Lignipirellula cremea]QDU92660.1 hypothetical protein Pla8534_04080 [Lignipirellula cremea]
MGDNSPAEPPAGPRPFQFRLRTLLIGTLCVAVFLATDGLGVVGLHYARAVDNDPLLAPVRVVRAKKNRLELADGRVLRVESTSEFDAWIKTSSDQVDLELHEETRYVTVFGKTRGWICGTPWIRLINIPLIPDDVPINRRQIIAYGEIVTNPDAVAQSNR